MNNHALRVYESMLGLLSGTDNPTPLVRLNRVAPFEHATIYAKLEWYNPFGSVKDRVAANLVRDAEDQGVLGSIKNLVEPTSGNTGMGLAMVANAKGYTLTAPLSSEIPLAKRTVLRFFGCDVIELEDTLCPAPGAPEGAIVMAQEIADKPDFHMLNQYENEANPGAHYLTTGPEIWKQTGGKVTHFVAGLGTCGTIGGTGRFLKEQNPSIKVLGVHPEDGHDIPGVRSIRQLSQTKLYRPKEYDQTIEVRNEDAYRLCLRLNREESLVAGPSSGMALTGALEMVSDEPGTVVVVIFPDNVFKYATSVRKHLPELFPPQQATPNADPSPGEALFGSMMAHARRSPDVIDAGAAAKILEENRALLIDVRSPEEFAERHVKGAINIPLGELDQEADLPADHDAPLITLCAVGQRSLVAMLVLKSIGYRNVKNVAGGLNAWVDAGLPT